MSSATIDGLIDSIESPETTGRPIPQEVMKAPVVFGYLAGNSWLTFSIYERARPDLARLGLVLPISLTYAVPHGTRRCMYDIEDHGGRVENIGLFADRVPRPFYLYTFASQGSELLAAARGFGFRQGEDFFYCSAHATGRPHICAPDVCGYPRADLGQYLFAGTYDKWMAFDYALPSLRPQPVDPYAMFPEYVGDARMPNRGNERLTAEQVDGALEAWHNKHLYHDYLKGQLRGEAKAYRDRCWRVAKFLPPDFTKPNPHPAWADERRLGARWQAWNNRLKRIDAIK